MTLSILGTTYEQRVLHQHKLWVKGHSIHNEVDDECCPDFSCCFPGLFEEDPLKRQQFYFKFVQRHNQRHQKGKIP